MQITESDTVYAGERHTLTCTVTADIIPKVTWIGLDGETLTSNLTAGVAVEGPNVEDRTTKLAVTFFSLASSQAGQYRCQSIVDQLQSTVIATQNLTVLSK